MNEIVRGSEELSQEGFSLFYNIDIITSVDEGRVRAILESGLTISLLGV